MTGPNQIPIVPEVDVVSAWEQARAGQSYILDVREPDELVEIAVPHAIHLPLGLLPEQVAAVPRDRDLLVICRSGVRSAYATEFLLQSGFQGVRNITGGVIAWFGAGLPFTSNGTAYNSTPDEDGEN